MIYKFINMTLSFKKCIFGTYKNNTTKLKTNIKKLKAQESNK